MALPASSITVNDGAATPVAQTFSIADRTGLVSVFRNMVSSLVRGAQKVTHEIKLAKTPNAANRALVTLEYPVEGVVDGQTTVIRSSLLKVEMNFSPNAPEIERQTAYGLFINLLSQADVKQSIIKMVSLG